MANLKDVLALIDHISVKLPNINIEANISLSNEQLELLANFIITKEDNVDELTHLNTAAVISEILRKHNKAIQLLKKGIAAAEQGDVILQEQIYRDFTNKYMVWFQNDCFSGPASEFLKKMAVYNETANKNKLCLEQTQNNHNLAKNSDHLKEVVVIGAGPTGLMAALKLYESGAKVTLIEARSNGLHTRKQTVVLDVSIMADLRHYLGESYKTLFKKGHIHPDGRGHIKISDLEKAMFLRLSELSVNNSDLRIIVGHAADKILTPDESNPKFRVSIEGSDETFNCDYVYAAEGGKHAFSEQRYLLGQGQKAKLDVDTTPNTYITMIYEINEDSRDNPLQSDGPPQLITKIRDKLKLTNEEKLTFANHVEYKEYFSHLEDDVLRQEVDAAFSSLESTVLPDEIDLRTFETRGQFYIASEVPPQFHHAMDVLGRMNRRPDLNQRDRELALNTQRSLQHAWSNLLSRYQLKHLNNNQFEFLNDRRVKLDYKSSQTFQVTPSASPLAARILKKNDVQLMVVAGGDLFRSPHFYSGTGISSAHAGVNAFQEYFSNTQQSPLAEKDHQRLFLARMQHVARFVDGKMGEYCNYTNKVVEPTLIGISEVNSAAVDIDTLIKDIQEYNDRLKSGLFSLWFFRAIFQSLRQKKIEVFDELLIRVRECTNFTDLQKEVETVAQEKKEVLGRHRYSWWSGKTTRSEEYLSNLQQRTEMAKESETISSETTDINNLFVA